MARNREALVTITLYGRASSNNVQKVLWALGELGLAYEHVPLGGRFGGNKTAEYLAKNPNGVVPTLTDGGLVVWESHAIVRYLAATYGAGTLWPEDPRARAAADQWTDWTATTFQPPWIGVFWNLVRTPEAQRDRALIEAGIAETERCLTILDGQLAKTRFVAGDGFTYVDIAPGVAMYRWSTMAIARQPHPNVERWHRQLQERQAFRDAVEVDYGELVGRLAF
jgi:glutathione S-transferase